MAHTQSIFDRLRSMQTEGQPLHALIVEACEVGNELLAALDKIADAEGCQPGHVNYLSKTTMSAIAARAAALAYADHGDTPDNGARAA